MELANALSIGGPELGAMLPADVKIENGATQVALSVKNVEELDVDFGDAELVSSLDVHISGVAQDNTVPMVVNLGAILEAGLGDTELKLYHHENGTPVLMTRVASVEDFAIHNQYVYNAETGEVTIYVASFSIFSAVKTNADVWDGETSDTTWYDEAKTEFTLTTVEQFVGFRDLVDGGNTFEGKTVKLGVDIDLNGKLFDPIGYNYVHLGGQAFMGTFDAQNHTIYGLYQNGWELGYSYSTAGGGLFASIQNATIKNLVMSGANIVMECIDMGIVVGYAQGTCHFENIVVTNSTIANYNRATGAVVGEVTKGSYGTDVTKGYSHTFKNIVVDSSVVVSSLWGSFDTLIGGVIGGKWGDATVKMENVITAAELDVYSDVTAAYQWYAYRRCGMLIGYTEQESPKKADHAHADFLTCENVNVYYGDWVNYTYYEFENQDNGTGQRYPWVRAENSPVGNNGAFSNPRYGVPTHGGKPVTELTPEELAAVQTDYTPIIFNQLYGGGQGVYGTNEHEGKGVTIHYTLDTKTIYIENNLDWENIKLYYWFAKGNDTWTTLVDGIALTEENGYYKLELPSYVHGFRIIADGDKTTNDVLLTDVTDKAQYSVGHFVDPITIYFQNNWLWSNVYIYYWYGDDYNAAYPGVKMTKVENDGVYDVYSFTVPMYAEGFIISDGSGDDTKKTQNLDIVTTEENTMFYMNYNNTDKYHALTLNYTTYKNNHTIAHLKPIGWWGGARYAAYVWNGNGNKWIDMVDLDKDGIFTCWVPNDYKNVIFGRMNTQTTNNSFDESSDLWNKTGDLTLTNNANKVYIPIINSWTNASDKILYLKPSGSWVQNNERYAAYFFGNGEKWVGMTDVGDGYYACIAPTGYPSVIFCRMNGSTTANNWNNKWDQTADLTVPTNAKNLYMISDSTWSTK